MLSRLYAKWMYSWETALTTRDTNRIVRPLEWGFDWLKDFSPLAAESHAPAADDYARMIAVNADIVARADEFTTTPRLPTFASKPPSPALPHQRPPRNPPGRRRNQTPGRNRRTRRGPIPPLHLAHSHHLPRKRHRQRPLVSRAPRNPKGQTPPSHDRHASVER